MMARYRGARGETRASLRWWIGVPIAAVTLASFVGASGSSAQGATRVAGEQLPAGFTDTRVASINLPIAFAATPDGRMLVVDETGYIDVIEGGAVLARATIDTQKQIALLQSTFERVSALLAELPGMGLMRRFAGWSEHGAPEAQPAANAYSLPSRDPT